MGRRWVVRVNPTDERALYLGPENDNLYPMPVTVTYARKFKTRHEGLEVAEALGFTKVEVKRTWC